MPIIHGGRDGALSVATKVLTNAQIKALPTTPVEIIAAPGVGKAIYCPIATGSGLAMLSLHWAADYTNLDPALRVSFRYQDGASVGGKYDFLDSAGFFAWGDADGPVWPIDPTTSSASTSAITSASVFAVENISLAISNGALGNLTGGDAANTLTVTVFYATLPIPA